MNNAEKFSTGGFKWAPKGEIAPVIQSDHKTDIPPEFLLSHPEHTLGLNEELPSDPDLAQEEGDALLESFPGDPDFKALLKAAKLTKGALAKKLGLARMSIYKWKKPPRYAVAYLKLYAAARKLSEAL